MRRRTAYLALGIALVAIGGLAALLLFYREPRVQVDRILGAYREETPYGGLTIVYPLDGTVFPPEIVPPRFRWDDGNADSDAWLVTIRFRDDRGRMSFSSLAEQWTPSDAQWEAIRRRSLQRKATVAVLGVNRADQEKILSGARISISTSKDEVGAPLFYREVNLPFLDAVKDPSQIRWRFGPISSKQQPPVVLEKLPVCGNCHSFSSDGAVLGMDVDYASDKGSYVIGPVTEDFILDDAKIITWSDYRREDGEVTFGLLSQVSPDGKYVVSTVKDESVFVPKEDLAFSQLFFPIKGVLVVYSRETGTFRALPGADDRRFVQSNPAWSPDGKHIVFARSKVHRLKNVRQRRTALLAPEECSEFLEGGQTFLFDLYRIPFNDGNGGTPEPLEGASQNGMSNYFPKYSPDGKWIVFCQAKSFMLLQPDSELYIIPAEGGQPRRLRCNTERMNSWHSWSPNGRWLVFSSKAWSPYTQLFLTHIDAEGHSTPPVVLERFTTPSTAANIPEFVNARPDAIKRIRQQFLDAHSYFRAGHDALRFGFWDEAERAYRMALKLDPSHAQVHNELGIVLTSKERFDEAEAHLTKALELDPELGEAHGNLGNVLARQGKFQEAIAPLREALRINPEDAASHQVLGTVLIGLGRPEEGKRHLDEAVRLTPELAEARRSLELGDASLEAGRPEQAAGHYRRALDQCPELVPALLGLASVLATADQEHLRNGSQAVALARKACDLTGNQHPRALGVLAAAHAEAGQFARAIDVAERAARAARAAGDENLAQTLQGQREQYQQGKPLRRRSR